MNEAQRAAEMVEGTLDQVLFINDQNGYVVAVLRRAAEAGGDRLTVVGNLGGVEVGAGLRAHGRFEKHPRYGEQFKIEDFEILRPAGVAALERYLASEIKGVGPALARRIAEHFGESLPEVLDREPERLHEVRGLGAVVAERIAAAWRDSSGMRELTVFLRGHGIAAAHARRIHQLYGHESLAVVRRDPYLLAREIHGIGFRTADTIAERLGIPRNSIERARGAILYLLERMAEEGHVFAPLGYITHQFASGLEMDPELATVALAELEQSGAIVAEPVDDDRAVYLKPLYEAECNVARRLVDLSRGRPIGPQVVERAMAAATMKDADFTLSPEQQGAIRAALRSRVTVITGGPGTGKTTILRRLILGLDAIGIRATLAAPTGRAARRLADASGREAKTIHRLLEYSPDSGEFIRCRSFPLRTNYLIVDEASMMDIELAASLLDALPPQSTLLLVGDRDQLPSVGPGSVLKDVIASGLAPVVALSQVYRQARESRIVANAHRLNRGYPPEVTNDPEDDFFFFERASVDEVLATIKQLVQQRLVGKFGISDAREIQVLTPMNRGPLGTQALNRELQELLNPAGRELKLGDRRLREGDRVIQIRNNYDKLVFNGAVGRIISIDTTRGAIGVTFEDGSARYETSELDQLALGYAISIHKSQGSQYPAVVIPVHQSHYLMLRRNLLYTAITRAERVCVLVGTRSALLQAVRNEDERRRFSRLAEQIRLN
ncbi:MAG TPA: ATP-dependent RecD-like DNA helicase [Candidatus Binataceae bacterium]|nr:ATP-dependent RecD-like DNA helicase [Candidatus Binataceae bacterium]